MKKIILFVLCLSVIVLTGCDKKDNNTSINVVIESNENGPSNKELNFDGKKTFNNMEYTYPNTSEVNEYEDNTLIEYKLNKDDENEGALFSIVMTIFKNTSIEDAMAENTATSKNEVNINGINWVKYTNEMEAKTINTYVYRHNEDTYAIDFIINSNVDTLEENFLKNIKFK